MINKYVIYYYETKDHYESDALDELDDVFYSEKGYTGKAYDLMYRLFYYKIIVKDKNTNQVEKVFSSTNFNRKQYKQKKF